MRHEELRLQPLICSISRSCHTRDRLRAAFRGAPYSTLECDGAERLAAVLDERHPDILIVDLSPDDGLAQEVTQLLAAYRFRGALLPIGASGDGADEGLRDLAAALGIVLMPALNVPIQKHRLHAAVTGLLTSLVPGHVVPVLESKTPGQAPLELWYQPKIDAHGLVMRGAEALLRMRHPVWGVVPPGYFVSEDGNPRLASVSEAIVTRVSQDWHDFFGRCGDLELAINLPVDFLHTRRSMELLADRLPDHAAFGGLIIESNSTDIVRNLPRLKEVAHELRDMKVAIAVDDLGADWPALVGLDRFPFVEIKVDQRFVMGCADDTLKQSICQQMLALARDYGARTVAEGVQTWPDFVVARELGFDLVQGFLFAEPMHPERFARTCWANPPAHLSHQPRHLPGGTAFPAMIPEALPGPDFAPPGRGL